jgi:hypothetical protein
MTSSDIRQPAEADQLPALKQLSGHHSDAPTLSLSGTELIVQLTRHKSTGSGANWRCEANVDEGPTEYRARRVGEGIFAEERKLQESMEGI